MYIGDEGGVTYESVLGYVRSLVWIGQEWSPECGDKAAHPAMFGFLKGLGSQLLCISFGFLKLLSAGFEIRLQLFDLL